MNEGEIEKVLSEGNLIAYKVVDMAKLNFGEQLKVRI